MADTATLQANVDQATAAWEQAFDSALTGYNTMIAARRTLESAQASGNEAAIAAAQAEVDAANAEFQSLDAAKANAKAALNEAGTALKNANGEDPTNGIPSEQTDGGFDEKAYMAAANEYESSKADTSDGTNSTKSDSGRGNGANIPFGATKSIPAAAQAQWSQAKDLRVKLRVPNEYLTGPAAGPSNILQKNGGILFPYTPQINVDNQASYSSQSPLHSNYPLYSYKSSSVGPINVTAKFTVQNEFEGATLLGIIHLLRGLTKMKWGNDPDAGSPPPVCRFDAYGDFMLYNVPVSVASWRHELPDGVDYIAVGRPGSPSTYGHSMVPTISTINLTLNVMYSRREMLAYNVKDWQSGGLKYRGYL